MHGRSSSDAGLTSNEYRRKTEGKNRKEGNQPDG